MASKMRNILPHRVGHLHRNGGTGSAKNSRASSPARGPAPLATDAKPLILKVYVIRGRDLAAKDKSGTSDPYLVVNLGTARQSTPSISKNLNPEWKVCFDMPLTGVPLLECVCWDKDRFGKDYMGEFDLAVEDIFSRGGIQAEPKWYKLKSKRKSRGHGHKHDVSGEVQLQFSLIDSANPAASPEDIRRKFRAQIMADEEEDDTDSLSRLASNQSLEDDLDDDDDADSLAEVETDSMSDANSTADKKKKKRKLRMLRRKSIAVRAYEFSGKDSDISGMVFMELLKVTDLPPEKNMTRTTFDCDPFVVTALGRKVLRTKVIKHNLNPVYNEKMVFQVMKHELRYSLTFSIMDRDKLSGNDFIASAAFSIQKLTDAAPEPDPQTGLYLLPEPQEYSPPPPQTRSKFRLPLSRSSSSSALNKLDRPEPLRSDSQLSVNGGRPMLNKGDSQSSLNGNGGSSAPTSAPTSAPRPTPTSAPSSNSLFRYESEEDRPPAPHDPSMQMYTIPLELQNQARWEDKHFPKLYLQARYLPYTALRQQFWRAMLKQYDTDDSRRISKIELTTMLDTLGSTLRESTIDGFFQRWAGENELVDEVDLTFDQAIMCLEEQLMKTTMKPSVISKVKSAMHHMPSSVPNGETSVANPPQPETSTTAPSNEDPTRSAVPSLSVMDHGARGEAGELVHPDDLADDSNGEEHVIEIRECPICHQPKLNKRADADIITHIATCASEDWRSVNTLVMGGFVTQSQAQRKWYSKIINKVSYGGYKLGANSANILVQDRTTGQINEERMSVYVRLGIRLLYKALGSREMEKKRIKKMLRSLSFKQGKKYDDPASVSQIEPFINFHRLDMSEVLLPTSDFRNFNEFFYRALKPEARPCSAPDRPEIIVSPADSRTVVFNTIDEATKIWVKGRDFTIKKLFGDAYPLDAKRYVGGSMGIFRLAPQDYHRFHIPVDGTLGVPKPIDGEYYTVNPMAIRSALDVYGENIRVIVPIDSVAHGRVMYVCIGAMMVGSTVITRKAGEKVKRAEELGYFKFGGSTILLFFEPGRMVYDDDLVDNSNGALETLVRVGMSLGHSPNVEPHRPDMKKNESEVTNEERQAAKRRIEGSLAPDDAKRAGLDTGLHIS